MGKCQFIVVGDLEPSMERGNTISSWDNYSAAAGFPVLETVKLQCLSRVSNGGKVLRAHCTLNWSLKLNGRAVCHVRSTLPADFFSPSS